MTKISNNYNWLLLRGLARDSRHWNDFPLQLQQQFPDSQILCLDNVGNGTKNQKTSYTQIKEYVFDLRKDFLNTTKKNDRPWNIIGASMGGMITLSWLNEFPTDFKKSYILSSSAANTASIFERLKPFALQKMLKAATSLHVVNRERHILELATSKSVTDANAQRWARFHTDAPTHVLNFCRQLYACAQFEAPKSITTPMHFIVGAEDNMVAFECSQKLAQFYNATLTVIPDAGHELHLDAHERLIDILEHN